MNVNCVVDSAMTPIPRGDPDDSVLCLEGEERWTRRELRDRRDHFVRVLSHIGIGVGDRASGP